MKGGHYTTSLRKNNDNWIKICDISKDSHIVTDTTPLDGYIFLYEKPDKGNSDLDLDPNANANSDEAFMVLITFLLNIFPNFKTF